MLVVLVTFFIVFFTAILSAIEAALLCTDDIKLSKMLQKNTKHKKAIKYVVHHKTIHLSSLVILTTLVSIAGSSTIGAMAGNIFDDLGITIFTIVFTYCMLAFAKILPKLVATKNTIEIIQTTAPFIKIACIIMKPLLWITMYWTKIINLCPEKAANRDDLKYIIQHYTNTGIIEQEERMLAEYALNLQTQHIKDLIHSEKSIICLPYEATIQEVYEQVKSTSFKRYIAISENEVKGVVLYRHLANAMLQGDHNKTVKELTKAAIFLTPNTTLLEAVEKFKTNRASIAILPGNSPEENQFITAKQIFRAILFSKDS